MTTYQTPLVVQGPARAITTGSTLTPTLTNTPVQGNLLIMLFGAYQGTVHTFATISSITQAGVAWYPVASTTANDYFSGEAWIGVVTSVSAAKGAAIVLSRNATNGGTGLLYEASGVVAVGTTGLDQLQTNTEPSGYNPSTGQTPATTQGKELIIGCTVSDAVQSSYAGTNSFTFDDGTLSTLLSIAGLHKVVSVAGPYISGSQMVSSHNNCGVIITLFAAPVVVVQYPITVTQTDNGTIAPDTLEVNQGDNQVFTITPDTGYETDTITVDGSSVAVDTTYTFTNVQASHTITATYTLIPIIAGTEANIQIIINDADVSSSSISTAVEQLEDAVWMCTLSAVDEDGANYLNSLVLNETVQVKMIADSNPPTAIEWLTDSTVVTTFVGTVQELSPIMTESGQICGVVAYGYGFQLKQLRVALELGNILPVPTIAPVYTFDSTYNEWGDTPLGSATGKFGDKPYISKYSGITFTTFGIEPTYIASTLLGHIGSTIGNFNFQLSPDFVGGSFAALELHIVATLTQDSESNTGPYPLSATVTPYYSVDDGLTWHPFTNGSFVITSQGAYDPNGGGTQTYFDTYGGGTISADSRVVPNNTGGCVYGTGGSLDGGDLIGSDVKFPHVSFTSALFGNYDPFGHIYCPPYGQDIPLNIEPDIPYWKSNFKVKLTISGETHSGGSTVGGISIAMMYLYVNFNQNSGYTIRQLITGESLGVGLIPNFVDRTIPDTVNLNGMETAYTPNLNTDYVMMDNWNNVKNLIPYLKYPYEDCLTALQDIIKYGSALQFLQGNAGYHWIIDVVGHLILATTNNHDVYGDHYIGEMGPFINTKHISDVWTLQPYPYPLKVKVDMITQAFKTEPPQYNYIYISGNFQTPLNDDYFRDNTLSYIVYYTNQYTPSGGYNPPTPEWLVLYDVTYGERNPSIPDMTFYNYYDVESPEPCIRMRPAFDTHDCTFLRPFNYNNPVAGAIDFTKLMGKKTVPSINFWLRTGDHNSQFRLRLYCDDGTGHPNIATFFEYDLSDVFDASNLNFQQYVQVNLPNTKYQRDYGHWKITTDDKYSLSGVRPLTLDWSDFAHVAYFGIVAQTHPPLGGNYSYILMRGFSVTGTVLKAMYDSLSIFGGTSGGITYPAYGVRQTTIKDTFAQTDNLSFSDIGTTQPNPLTLELIYDLQRYRKVRTTGEIEIPLNPFFTAGQQVWIQAEETIPNGASIYSGGSNPTTGTVGTLGAYYVNTSGSTLDQYGNYNYPTWICTNIVGTNYTWTATGLNQYKINKWMRATKVSHLFALSKAVTRLKLTDDLTSSLTVDTRDVFSVTQRTANPDFQSKTLGSLKSKDDFDLGLVPIAFDLYAYMTTTGGLTTSAFAAL